MPKKSSDKTQILTFCQLSITRCANAIAIFLEEKFEYIQICRMNSFIILDLLIIVIHKVELYNITWNLMWKPMCSLAVGEA